MKNKKYVYQKLTILGNIFWFLGVFRIYADGNGLSAIYRWYHPITWLLYVAYLIPCAVIGEKIFEALPLTLSDFWYENIDQIQWLTPFTRLESIRRY